MSLREEIAPIIQRHIAAARGKPEAMAEVYQGLAHVTGIAVADGCKGQTKIMGDILEGMSNYMMEVAAGFAPIVRQHFGVEDRDR